MKRWQTQRVVMVALTLVAASFFVGCESLLCPKGTDALCRERVDRLEGEVSALEQDLAELRARPEPQAVGAAGRLIVTRETPEEVNVGEEYEYTVRVENATGMAVENVEVTEHVPDGLEYVGAEPTPAQVGPPLKWNVGAMDRAETRAMKVRVRATGTGQFKSCALATHRTPTCSVVTVVEPALALRKTAPGEVLLCDDIPVTLEVENTGSGTARNVRIRDELPEGLLTDEGNPVAAADVGDLAPDESKQYRTVLKAQETGSYDNTAVAMGDGELRAESNTTTTVVRQPVLALTKEGPDKRFLGQEFTYTITVENTGDGVAQETTVEDELPDYAEMVNASDGGTRTGDTVRWNLGTLNPGDSRELSVTLRAAEMGTARNVATAEAVCAEAATARAETELAGIPAMLLEVVDVADPIEVGNNETYVIAATNQGSLAAQNVSIVVTMEEEMQYVSAEGPTDATVEGRTITFAPLATLAPKDEATWRVQVKAVEAGDVRLTVSMTSDRLTRPVEETEATNFYE